MPTRPLGPCRTPGCPGRATHHGRCARHAQTERQQYEATRPSSSARGYGSQWRRRRAAYLAQHPACVVCGQPATDVDHIVPRRQGGADDEHNYQALCHAHHAAKTARADGRWGSR